MDQTRITEPVELLDARGHVVSPGWATQPLWRYDPALVKGGRLRTKEWDYYAVICHEGGFALTLTLADLGYLGLAAVGWVDLRGGRFVQLDRMGLLPMGRMGLPPHPGDGVIRYAGKGLTMTLTTAMPTRRLEIDAPGFTGPGGEVGLHAEVELHQEPADDTMVIATSWPQDRAAFYYNQKVNCMPARGAVTLGGTRHELDPASAMGVLDWGRGRWTWRNRWYWGSASGWVDGVPFGFNLGYGFSDRSVATENMLFYGGKAHKLGEVGFDFDPADFMRPWHLTDAEGRLDLVLEPIVDRSGKTDLGLIRSIQHQVFGALSGTAVLDDGTRLAVDGLLGFAEDVLNWW